MQINSISQNKQVNFTSTVYIKNSSKIFENKKVQSQIARLEKNGKKDIISLKGFQSLQEGVGRINMNIIDNKTCEEREKDFFFENGKVMLGFMYKKLLKEAPINTWKF